LNTFNESLSYAVTFRDTLEENENINLPKSGRDPKIPPNVSLISLLYMTGQKVEKATLKTVQKQTDARVTLSVSVSWAFMHPRHDTSMYEI
jgi:hypothetical protein